MDICQLLKNINSVSQYTSVTHDALEKCKNSKIPLNMSTILSLKEIRSLEIEYYSKCEKIGIACVIFERLLCSPPSKIWGVLGKELVTLLQYWLNSLKRHLNNKFRYWWKFLKLLLKFLREIRVKDPSLPNLLVEHTTECLLELATRDQFEDIQQQEILYCLNIFCSESSREIRFALRNKFGSYFVKLALRMSSCGYLPCQYSVLETLLRWLLPRNQPALRQAVADKWFPKEFYSHAVADLFVERPWTSFFRDARDLLSMHNDAGDLITSVVCKSLTVGKLVIFYGEQNRTEAWLDINVPTKCLTVLLDPRLLESVGVAAHRTYETLLISDENTKSAKLYRKQEELTLSVSTHRSPQILPAAIELGSSDDVTIAVTSRCDLARLDRTLRRVFCDKYQVLLNIDQDLTKTPPKETEYSNKIPKSEEDPRFSHPAEQRRTRSGYIVRHRSGRTSPSTASTSSLAQLGERLAALPRFKFNKEVDKVCVSPNLSRVIEHSEQDTLSFTSTLRLYKPHGIITRNKNLYTGAKSPIRKSQSDGETYQRIDETKELSPQGVVKTPASCLLAATIGSADNSVINDTVERLSKHKDFDHDNIVDILTKEFLEAEALKEGEILDSGISVEDKKTKNCSDGTEAIENTPFAEELRKRNKQKYKLKKASSTDESNTECIPETPSYVNVRIKPRVKENKIEAAPRPTFDEKTIESFFSQHYAENKAGEIVVSPTLAKKLNDSSSDSSEDLEDNHVLTDGDQNIETQKLYDIDIISCLSSMVDKVCSQLNECSKSSLSSLKESIELKKKKVSKKAVTSKANMKSKIIKLTNKAVPKKTRATKPSKNKHDLQCPSKMSTIIEGNTTDDAINDNEEKNYDMEDVVEVIDDKQAEVTTPTGKEMSVKVTSAKREENIADEVTKTETPLIRRKRKLYSPKDEQVNKQSALRIPETEDDDDVVLSEFKVKNIPKTKASCYKEIEKERQKHIRAPRTRRSRNRIEPASLKTKKISDMFDKLKENVDGEKITLADKTFEADVYNFTSDSEDEYFKNKTIELRKNTSAGPSVESTLSRRGRVINRIDYSRNNSSDEKKRTKRKITTRKRAEPKVANKPFSDLVDEKIREATEVLNTSLIVEKNKPHVPEPDFILEAPPAMEIIEHKTDETQNTHGKKKPTKKTKAEKSNIKKCNEKTSNVQPFLDDDRTESPLPGLVVELVPSHQDDQDISASLLDKFKKIYQNGPESYVNESNTTQNLLSDVDKINHSTDNIDVIAGEEIIQLNDTNQNRHSKDDTKSQKRKKKPERNTLSRKVNKYTQKEETNKAKTVKSTIECNENTTSVLSLKSGGNTNKKMIDKTLDIRSSSKESTKNNAKCCDSNENIEVTIFSGKINARTIKKITSRTTPNIKTQVTSLKSNNVLISESNINIIDIPELSEDTNKTTSNKKDQSVKAKNLSLSKKFKDTARESKRDNKSEHNIEIISITDAPDVMSDKSIGSLGITGHGESEEQPPTPRLIEEDIQPRNIGFDDSNQLVNDYFDKLMKEINVSDQKNVNSESNEGNTIKQQPKSSSDRFFKSPIEPAARISLNDLERSSVESLNKTPVVSVSRLSLDDISKWLPSRRASSDSDKDDIILKSDGSVSRKHLKSVPYKSPKLKRSRKSFKRKDKREINYKSSGDDDFEDEVTQQNKEVPKKKAKVVVTTKNDEQPKRLSLISPIKLFDELISESDKKSEKSLSDDENFMREIKELHSTKIIVKSLRNRNISEVKKIVKTPSVSSDSSKMSTSTKIDNSRTRKRIISTEDKGLIKKTRVEINNTIDVTCDGMTLSSVSEWFKRNEPTSSREMMNSSAKDSVQNILEKLDTTLAEIHQNTSTKFVHLFVEAQRHLLDFSEQRVETRTAMSTMLAEFVKVVDQKITDWDNILKEKQEDFMKQLKEHAYEIIREDCEKKRCMVKLLREDVLAVLRHLDKP